MSDVRRRCVFYVSGFDPKGASHYHALYRDQAAAQAAVNGLEVSVGARRRLPSGNAFWEVDAVERGSEVHTHYEFMRWDDVVRAHWPKHAWQLWRDVFITTLFNLRHGSLWRMYRLSWPPAFALFMPFVLLCAVVLGLPLLAGWAGLAMQRASGSGLAGALAAAAVLVALGWGARRLEARYSMYWMMRSYAFTMQQALGRTPDLEQRLDLLADQLAARLQAGEDDEVLVVGHSSGAIMAVAVVARALRRLPERAGGARPALSLLTLGQWIPLLGLLPQADAFRRELGELTTTPALDAWLDFSAPPDGCCFALTDPLAACGLAPEGRRADRPKLLNPKFAEMFDEPDYQALRRDKFRLHFQYLGAAPKATLYDYFLITAGALTLAQRYSAHEGITDFTRLRPFQRFGA